MTKITYPIIIINTKTYPQTTKPKDAMKLAKQAEKVSRKTGICIAVAPQTTQIHHLTENTNVPIFAQHVDPITPGKNTGYTTPQAVKQAGAAGTLINHSEHQLKLTDVYTVIQLAKQNKLVTCVCANTPQTSQAVAALKPDMIAIEPPELIGTGIPVSKAQPETITDTIKLVEKVNPKQKILCGAGITKPEDVAAAIKLGTQGILVASGIVKAKNSYKIMLQFAEAVEAER
ncbi:MAG: triose-phosphate isomerase [Thermoproteota archaeon]|nr:triose-phosphate isomerase [Thermoproteota archaeon]